MAESGSSSASGQPGATPRQTVRDRDSSSPAPASEDPLSPTAAGLAVDVLLETDDLEPPLDGWLAEQVRRIAAIAGAERGGLTLVVVDDQQMSQLHDQFHGDPSTTDVLTFDQRDRPEDDLEGDVVVCVDEARRQAAARGHDVRLEVLLYALHGLLHLLGEDDHDPAAARRMHEREDELLAKAGFAPMNVGRDVADE